MTTAIIFGAAAAAAVSLIAAGVWMERRGRPPDTVIRPLDGPPPVTPRPPAVSLETPPLALPAPATPGRRARIALVVARVRGVIAAHPAPLYAWIETVLWLFVLATLVDHLAGYQHSPTGRVIWLLTIGPHELGHLICAPFSWTLMVLGGSIWQVVWWLGLAVYLFLVRRQISGSLLFWAITGHSFINMTPYIADARARELPLLFGMDSSHHDWWNLLKKYGLLEHDQAIAALASITGALIILAAVALGIMTAWVLPRTQIAGPRITHLNIVRALREALATPGDPGPEHGTWHDQDACAQ
jgi:hypothetical protein